MGRGDKKTKKGKIFMGSFGKSRLARPVKVKKEETAKEETAKAETKKEEAPKAETKKETVKD